MLKTVNLILISFVLTACVNGKFVGTNFVPTKMYDGESKDDTQVATVFWGVKDMFSLTPDKVMSPILAVNNKGCKSDWLLNYSDPGQSWCGHLVQLLPGNYSFTTVIRTGDRISSNGYNTVKVEWYVTKPFETPFMTEVKAGYVYSMEPVLVNGKYTVQIKELCKSNDHISSIKRYGLDGGKC